jgi:putative tricarboxylic transport membrane protein
MDLASNLAAGFGAATAPLNLLCVFAGCVAGMLAGVLPGVRPAALIAMLLPLAYAMPAAPLLMLLAAIAYGAAYGCASAALSREPGDAGPAASADLYQLARQGRSRAGISVASISLFAASAAGTLALAASAAPLAEVSFQFGPAEYLSLMALGLAGAAVLAPGSLLKGLAMIVLGLVLGVFARASLQQPLLGLQAPADGVGFLVLAVGLYGLGGAIANLAGATKPRDSAHAPGPLPGREELRQGVPALLRGTLLGCVLGVLPGAGRLLAAYAAYALERSSPLRPGEVPFGKGNLRAVAAASAAEAAGAQAAFVPLLALGIPTSAVAALLMGAMAVGGVQSGPQMMAATPQLFWGLIASMWIGNLVLIALSLPLQSLWTMLSGVSYRVLFPALVVLCALGVYLVHRDAGEVAMAGAVAVAGYVFAQLGCEPMPLLLGFTLGPAMEDQLRQAMVLSHGDWGMFLARPVSAGLLSAAVLLIILVALPTVKLRRGETFSAE